MNKHPDMVSVDSLFGPLRATGAGGGQAPRSQNGRVAPVVTVTVNPALDLFLQVQELVPGQLHRIQTPRPYAGGKGINVSKALHSFGVPTVATGFLGGSRGQWIEQELTAIGIDIAFIHTEAATRVNVKVTEAGGRLTELNSPAPELSSADWQALESHLQELTRAGGWLALCGNLPDTWNARWYQERIDWARKKGLHTVLDASGEALRYGILAQPDIIKPNLAELESLMGQKLKSVKEVVQAATQLCESGIKLVAVSMGGGGLVAVTNQERIWAHVPNVPVVSSVGAGDTVVAGILYGIHRQFSLADTIRFAAAAGTAAVRTDGLTRPSRADVEALLPEIQLEAPIES
ncbi:MAG: 1-phosphofructokinase [Alicyclobacillus herbarius]|uniref:1-phosphofructokinase n=1 Tax=Alicyclobacillus herbarius TaxID=122960 RepID=UPI0023536323|nr:1-phosphofructokinase [Alicyclobacillus herbarius]MCL6633268.1 1-phosphofructokinase [Alicyclobacillus herbarius]